MREELQNNVSLEASASNEASFLVKITNGLEKFTFFINNITHKISSVILFCLMFLTFFDVLGRYIFNKPITGTFEITGLATAVLVFFSLGMAQIKRDHIEIDFLTNMMPAKVQDGLYSLSSFVLFILMSLTTWKLFEYTKRIQLGNEISGDLGLPLFLFVGLAIVGAICFTFTFLVDTLKSLLKVVQK